MRAVRARRLVLAWALLLGTARAVAAQTLATDTFTAGYATFGLTLPAGAATDAVAVGAFDTQTDVKTTWPDGSIRFAVVTANIAMSGAYAITAGTPLAGSAPTTLPTALVDLVIAGQTYTATMPASFTSDLWLSGPLVKEARAVVTPLLNGTPHPLLQVVFDLRSYAGSGQRVDITVQNSRDLSTGDAVDYDVDVVIGGVAVFAKSAVHHSYLTRWRKTFTTGGLTLSAVTPDFEPLYLAGGLPRYLTSITDQVYGAVSGANFDILEYGDIFPGMGSTGWRPDISFYPDWVARYLVHKRPETLAYLLKHADLSGSWSGHLYQADGTTLVSLAEHPAYWLDSGGRGVAPNGPAAGLGAGLGLRGATNFLETAHLPSIIFAAYLLTGDRYYLDQQKLWANFVLLSGDPGDYGALSRTGMGILLVQQVRGIGRGMTVLADLVAYLPDTDADASYFATRLAANVEYFDNYLAAGGLRMDGSSIGTDGGPMAVLPWWLLKGGLFSFAGNNYFHSVFWLDVYVAFAAFRVQQLGFSGGATIRSKVATHVVRMFNHEDVFPREYAAPGATLVGVFEADWNDRSFFTSLATFATTNVNWIDQVFGAPTPLVGYYDTESRFALMLGESLGMAGATDARTWLEAYPNVLVDLNSRAGYAIDTVASVEETPALTGLRGVGGVRGVASLR